MTDTQFGNGKKLAECLKAECPSDHEVNIDDVKDIKPEKVAENAPDALILGGAIRMFRGDPKSRKWLKELNNILEKSSKKIKYGTGFLTHGLPTDKVQGFSKRYLNKIKKATMIEKTYSKLLTARVMDQKGPIYDEEFEKAKEYIKDFIKWMGK